MVQGRMRNSPNSPRSSFAEMPDDASSDRGLTGSIGRSGTSRYRRNECICVDCRMTETQMKKSGTTENKAFSSLEEMERLFIS